MAKYDISNIKPPVYIQDESLLEIPDLNEPIRAPLSKGSCMMTNATILHKWIIHLEKNSQLRVLIKDYLDKNPNDINAKNNFGVTPFMLLFMVWRGKGTFDEVLDFMIKRGVDPNVVDQDGHTALFVALKNKYPLAIIEKLLRYGFNVNHIANDGQGVGSIIISTYGEDIYRMLSQLIKNNGLDISKEKDSLLVTAFQANVHHFVKKYIMSLHNVKINATDKFGNTCLHLLIKNAKYSNGAEYFYFFDDLKLLLENKIDVSAKVSNGDTVVDLLKYAHRRANVKDKKIIVNAFEQILNNKQTTMIYPIYKNTGAITDETEMIFNKRVACYLNYGHTNMWYFYLVDCGSIFAMVFVMWIFLLILMKIFGFGY